MKELDNIDEIDLDRNIVIEASAGTGKTYTLERLYIRYLLEKGYDTGEILVVTFTEKAALELKERIRSLLRESLSEPGRCTHAGIVRLRNAFSAFSEAQIYTIHGFCSYCIQNFPFECGAPFRTSIIKSKELYREAVLDYFRKADSSDLDTFYLSFRKKYPDFEKAVSFLAEMLKNRRVFESGKTLPGPEEKGRLESAEDSFRQENGPFYGAVSALRECTVSTEVIEALSRKVKAGFRGDTFRKLAEALSTAAASQSLFDFYSDDVAAEASRLEKISFSVLEEKDKVSLLDPNERAIAEAVDQFLGAAAFFADPGSGGRKYLYHNIASFTFMERALEKIKKIEEQKKRKSLSMDFDDLISITRNALFSQEYSLLAQELSRKYRVVLVDEFQDTDKAQWDIFRKVFETENHNIVLIGDPKQSIYRFRGADLEIYFRAVESLSRCDRYRLATCYRSTGAMVKGVNSFFKSVFSRTSGGGHPVPYYPVESGFEKAGRNDFGTESNVTILGIENSAEDASKDLLSENIRTAYADEVAYLLNGGLSPSAVALLFESNRECFSMIEKLRERNIPAIYEGDTDIFESFETRMFVDLLYAISSPDDLSLVKKSLFTDLFGLSAQQIISISEDGRIEKAVMKFARWGEKTSEGKLYEVFDEIFYGRGSHDLFLDETGRKAEAGEKEGEEKDLPYIARKLRETGGERKAVNALQIAEMLTVRNMKEKENSPALLRYLLSATAGYEERDDISLRLDREPDCVRVMTIHKSKGLEFPVVFFGGGLGSGSSAAGRNGWYEYLENGSRIIDFTLGEESRNRQLYEQWEEKKRLYYVAMTRASVRLYLPAAKSMPDCDLAGFYSSVVYEELASALSPRGINLSLPLNIDRSTTPDGISVKEAKELFSNTLYSLLKDFCSGRDNFCFTETDPEKPVSAPVMYTGARETTPEQLQAAVPQYDRDNALSGISLYSYSSLSAGKHGRGGQEKRYSDIRHLDEREDEDEFSDEESASLEGLEGIRGSDFGNIMHKALETADYRKIISLGGEDSAAADPEILGFSELCARSFVVSEKASGCRETVARLLYRTLATQLDIGGKTLRIGDLPEKERRHETEFLIRVKEGSLDIPGSFENITLKDGFLKGFIDMIFRFEGKYYIIDWKTNNLGSSLRDYMPENIEKAMAENNYILQMNLYMSALDLIIESSAEKGLSAAEASPGGCFYLFLRGLSGDGSPDSGCCSSGIFFSGPDKKLIGKFRDAFIPSGGSS